MNDPKLLPFLPMLYVAWSDGDLSTEEADEICTRLDGDCASLLGPWLGQTPSAREMQRLLANLRTRAADLPRSERLTLAGLGLALAQADREVSDHEREALTHVAEVLGLGGSESARQLLATRHPATPPAPVEPSFDADALAALLEAEYAELRARLRKVLTEDEFSYERLDGLDRSKYRDVVLDWCRRLAAEGFGALSFPQEQGGSDDLGAFVVAFETLATHDLSLLVKFGVQFGLFGGSILNLGSERHHAEYLAETGSLDLPGCFAMTETSHGSNVQDLETTARFDPATREIEIHTPHEGARKDYIGNAARHGRLATVFAQLQVPSDGLPDDEFIEEHGIHAILVPIRNADGTPYPGVTIEDCGEKLGLNGVDNGRLSFDRVRVPVDNLLDRFAQIDEHGHYQSPIAGSSKRFFTMLGTLVGGRVSVALGGLSASKSALTIAIRYGAARRQFGPEHESEVCLLDYPAHQRRLLPRLAKTYALHFALHDLRRRFAAAQRGEGDMREIETRAAGLKAMATWHATDTIQACRECCGGQGYLAANRFAALKADTDVFTTFEGDNVVLLQLVAKGLLSGYRKHFTSGFRRAVGYLAGRAATRFAEMNPVAVRRTDAEHLRDREFQLAAFRWREAHSLAAAAKRLKRRLDDGMDLAQALMQCQEHLLFTSKSHVERLVLESFAEAIDGAGESAEILSALCDLFALSRLEAGGGWFLEHGYFEPVKTRAIRRQVDALCAEVRADASPLVRAFGIPQELLGAPIAR